MSNDPNLQRTAALTNLVGQVGCVTGFVALLVIGVSFGAGWLLDDLVGNERRIFTVIFMLASFPITLYAMVKVSLWFVAKADRISAEQDKKDEKENTAI